VDRRPVQPDDERVRADERPQEQPVLGVVDELEVEVGIVDGRVAAERVVADVQSVVRPLRDVQPGLERRVEHGRRDPADAAGDPRPELAVDDHRGLLEALLSVRSPVVPLNENVAVL
jgi:hypothetical protein